MMDTNSSTMNVLLDSKIHWLSIINSTVPVFLLLGSFVIILTRVVCNYLARYNVDDDDENSSELLPVMKASYPLLKDSKLLNMIDFDSNLSNELHRCELLTKEQIKHIESKSSNDAKVGQLLADVVQLPRKKQDQFLSVLEETHRSHVANYIRNNGKRPSNDEDKWPLVVLDQWVTIENKRRQQTLIGLMDPCNGLLDELYTAKFINRTQYHPMNDVQQADTVINEKLLHILESRSLRDYNKFVDCLLTTNQGHIVSLLEPSRGCDLPLNEQQKDKLQTNHSAIIQLMDSNTMLLAELRAAKSITERQMEKIQSAGSRSQSNNCLLKIIDRGSQSGFCNFIECLIKTGQQCVANLLTSDGIAAEVIATTSNKDYDQMVVNSFMEMLYPYIPFDTRDKIRPIVKNRLAELREDIQLIAMQSEHSIKFFILCKTLPALEHLRGLYGSDELRIIIQEKITKHLHAEIDASMTVDELKWDFSDYNRCATHLSATFGLPIFSQLHQFAQHLPQVAIKPISIFVNNLPYDLVEMVLMKATGQMFVAINNMTSQAHIYTLTALGAVCSDWRSKIFGRQSNRKLLRQYFIIICYPYSFNPRVVASLQLDTSVVGVVEFKGKLYAVTVRSNRIQVFDTDTKFRRTKEPILVPGLRQPMNVVVCSQTGSLYISDMETRCIWQVSLSSDNISVKFRPKETDYLPYTLATQSGRLVVTQYDSDELHVYGNDGHKIKRVKLNLPANLELRHAIETSRGTFIVCHPREFFSDPTNHASLSEVTVTHSESESQQLPADIQVVHVYKGQKVLSCPYYLTTDADQHILVADLGLKQILHLDPKLNLKHILLTTTELSGEPVGMFYSGSSGLLYVWYDVSSKVDVYKVARSTPVGYQFVSDEYTAIDCDHDPPDAPQLLPAMETSYTLLKDNELLNMIDFDNDLHNELHRCELLTKQQIKHIEGKSSNDAKVGQLLADVVQLSREKHDQFLSVLEETRRSHVANYIRKNGKRPSNDEDNWPLLALDQWKTIEKERRQLIELMDPCNGLLDELYIAKFISWTQYDQLNKVQQAEADTVINEKLLHILKSKSVHDFNTFVDCLRTTEQGHLLSLLEPSLESDLRPLSKQEKDMLETNFSSIVELMDPNTMLLVELQSAKSITNRQVEYIERAETKVNCNIRLLKIISRGSQTAFRNFRECLIKTGQKCVADLLTSDGIAAEIIATTSQKVKEQMVVSSIMKMLNQMPSDSRDNILSRVKDIVETREDIQLIAMQTEH